MIHDIEGFTGLTAKPLACGIQPAYNGMASAVFSVFPQHLYRALHFPLDKWALHNGRFFCLSKRSQWISSPCLPEQGTARASVQGDCYCSSTNVERSDCPRRTKATPPRGRQRDSSSVFPSAVNGSPSPHKKRTSHMRDPYRCHFDRSASEVEKSPSTLLFFLCG